MQSLLSVILLFPALGALVLLCVPSVQTRLIRILGLSISCITFVLSLLLWVFFDHSTAKFQFVDAIDWLPFLNMHFYIGIDGISLFFILLTTFLVPFCLLVSWDSVQKKLICRSNFSFSRSPNTNDQKHGQKDTLKKNIKK